MKLFTVGLFTVVLAGVVRADSWGPARPQGSASPNGDYVLRIEPGDWRKGTKPAVAVVYKLDASGGSYVQQRQFPLVNRESPVDACISNEGEVFTFDDWLMMGYEHVLVCYGSDGAVKKEFSLKEMFPADVLDTIEERHRTHSSINWRKGRPFINGPVLLITDALGGYLALEDLKIEYHAKGED